MNSLLLILSRKRYFAPVWVFASINIMVGTWVLYIPRVKEKLMIDDGDIGIALFCYAIGGLFAVTFSSKLIDAIGVGKATLYGIVVFALLFLFPIIAPSLVLLCVSLFVAGMSSAFTDIAMNALVSELEKEDGVHFMSAAHAFFSLGGVLGAGIGSLVIGSVTVSFMHIAVVTLVLIVTNILLSKNFIAIASKPLEKEHTGFSLKLVKPIFALTIISFIVMGSEGSLEQWSKLYLEDVVGVSLEWLAGFGFVIFSAAMTLGRFFGDEVSSRIGSYRIIIYGLLIAIVGYMAILSRSQALSLVGFGLVGIGFSVIIPELFRVAGKAKGVTSSQGISIVAGMGFVGFMAGPAIMGSLADIYSLWTSYLALGISSGIALVAAFLLFLKRR
ncbi:MFS transporter [uncultured Dokdonia sp.]|uniref:MFS transporter n=1 Tax=uncultured Dokdonia sp. TaxID=575653 RepID=UPI0026144512|nr:MFS transporter [uncultured Dokdonia sp.]